MIPERTAWQTVWRTRDRRPIWEWAHDKLVLKSPYAIEGPFDISRSRHFIAPFEALADDHTREVSILKPVRGGGSLIGDVWFAWTMANDPGPFLNAFQTDPIAGSHWDKKLKRLLECVGLMPEGKIGWKEVDLLCGETSYVCGPSINNLQSRGFRRIRLDEPWLYPDMMGEARARIGDFLKLEISQFTCISQGGPKPGGTVEKCDWCRHCADAELDEWSAQCPKCGEYFNPKFFDHREDGSFAGMIWEKIKLPNGDWDVDPAADTCRIECPNPKCAAPLTDMRRVQSEWNRTGKYAIIGKPNRRHRLFHWDAVIDYPWRELTVLWLKACNAFRMGVTQPKIEFYQKYCAKNYDERMVMESGQSFARVKYEVSTEKASEKLPGELLRPLTVDKQQEDTYWWTVRAWFPGGRSRRLGFGKAYSYAELEEIRIKFGVLREHVGIDSKFQPKGDQGVYAACCRYLWIALQGADVYFFVHRGKKGIPIHRSYSTGSKGDPESGRRGEGTRFCLMFRFSKPIYNRRVQTLIDNGLWEEPEAQPGDEMEAEYSRQMAGRFEKQEYSKKDNRLKKIWWEGKNDHARDLANMQIFFATAAKILADNIETLEETK